MFTESEVDNDIDFVPENGKLCEKCVYFTECPLEYRCESLNRLVRWEFENLDVDYTN